MMKFRLLRYVAAVVIATLIPLSLSAQEDSVGIYTKERPLVYEDAWDLWPYAYLNDNGDPEGFNIDLIRMMMQELNIPYVIKLKPAQKALEDLRDGQADLTFGLATGFHDAYGRYGKTALTLFTQSVVSPKNKPVEINTFKDLGKPGIKVTVKDSSLCHHLMIDYGWGENAVPSPAMREAITQLSAKEDGCIVWNTLSLKWLLKRYHIDNLELTPVNMPHGEYKFMSNNQQLLNMLDDTYVRLSSTDKLRSLQTKWFYPDRETQGDETWTWQMVGGALLALVVFTIYLISFFLQYRRIKRENRRRNQQLALILETSKVRIWSYDIARHVFSWHNENGQVAFDYTIEEFATRYSESDFAKVHAAIRKLATIKLKENGEEPAITIQLKATDREGGDNDLHDFIVNISVLQRDPEGMPITIIGTKKDVTYELEQKRLDEERTLRYWTIFYTPIVGIILFDKNGYLVNINPKASELFECDPEKIIEEHVSIHDLLDTGTLDLNEVNGYFATQVVNIDAIPMEKRTVKSVMRKGWLYNEFRLTTVNDENGNLIGVFAFCRDVSAMVHSSDKAQEGIAKVAAAKAEKEHYAERMNHTLDNSDIRLVIYSPDSHTLAIHKTVDKAEHALTQTRCMTLVDDNTRKTAMRMLNNMDARIDKTIEGRLTTTLRTHSHLPLTLHLKLQPMYDRTGAVTHYQGLLQDVSEQSAIAQQMQEMAAKAQEVENTKNRFVKNMVQEIREPMDTLVKYVNRLDPDRPGKNEAMLTKGILDNSDYLIHLIDNILYLSRLETNMVEINKKACNFAELFEPHCMNGWGKYQNADTRYIIENPYDQLVVDIDAESLGQVIRHLTENAAQHTKSGIVRARYDYIGRRLIISIDDTGEGIPKKELLLINTMKTGQANNTKGLGLAITKELVRQMGGTVEISSELGSGTTVYVMLPCHASDIKRKKLV